MKKLDWIIIIGAAVCVYLLIDCLHNKVLINKNITLSHIFEKECEVKSIGDTTLFLDGNIELGVCLEKIHEAKENSEKRIDLLVIRSNGGNSSEGVEIGKWVSSNDVSVEVKDYCISSCANYIFPAGKEKIIQKDAVIGWHGSEISGGGRVKAIANMSNGEYAEEEIREKYFQHSCSKRKIPCVDDHRKSAKKLQEQVYCFYKDYLKGVNPKIMNYGLYEGMDFYNKYIKYDFSLVESARFDLERIRSWTYSIEGMERFGITNITYKGDGEYPNKDSMYKSLIQRRVIKVKESVTPHAVLEIDCDSIK